MALESRLRELDTRHRVLDEAIRSESQQPSVDPMRLTSLKRQKLKLKEEIETLRRKLRH